LVNRLYYDLQFLVAPCEAQEATAIQHLILMEFIKLLCLVDESAILLLYKTFFAVKGNVLYELDKLSQSYMAVSKYFQGFSSWKVNETMYVSVLLGYDSPRRLQP